MNKNKLSRSQKTALAAGIILIAVLTLSVFFIYRTQTLSAAFWNVDEATASGIGKVISSGHTGRIVLKTLDGTKPIPASVSKKYHLLFAWDGKYGTSLTSGAPGKLNTQNAQIIPILTDSYELAFNTADRKKTGRQLPRTLEELSLYMRAVSGETAIPFACAGGDDDSLLAFLSSIAESMGGTKGYESLKKEIAGTEKLADIIDKPLAATGSVLTLRTIIDTIRSWQKENFLSEEWLLTNTVEINNLLDSKKAGIVFIPLSKLRKSSLKINNYYEMTRFMPAIPGSHALVAPQLCAVVFKKSAGEAKALARLNSPAVQEILSKISAMAPSSADAAACDSYAEDVRFWASSCAGGAVPPATSSHSFAEEVRAELRK